MKNSHKSVDRFSDDREALDFIAARIADEAQREGVQLSVVERKMLYFSETAWTLPDIWEVNDKFDSEYDQDEYEKKISTLIKKALARARKQQPEEFDAWNEAIHRLSKDDRYLLVMTGQAGIRRTFRPPRPPSDLWKLWGTALAIVAWFLYSAGFLRNIISPPPRAAPIPRISSNSLSGSSWQVRQGYTACFGYCLAPEGQPRYQSRVRLVFRSGWTR